LIETPVAFCVVTVWPSECTCERI